MQPGELFLTRQQHDSTAAGVEASERDEGRQADSLNDCFGQLSEYLNIKNTLLCCQGPAQLPYLDICLNKPYYLILSGCSG